MISYVFVEASTTSLPTVYSLHGLQIIFSQFNKRIIEIIIYSIWVRYYTGMQIIQ
jgi:hypothetical protein